MDIGRLSTSDRNAIISSLYHEGRHSLPFLRRFVTLMGLSVALAVLGILANSTAVVIGAMLIAPLMNPILAMSASLVMGWPRRLRRSATVVALSALGAVLTAAAISLAVPGRPDPLPQELLARTGPNLMDFAVGLAAGAAGAYAHVRRQVADAVAGAAIAVALVPPLSVVGITLQLGEMTLALGALMLFLINVTGIILSGVFTFLLSDFVPGHPLRAGRATLALALRWTAIVVIVVSLPLQLGRAQFRPLTESSGEVRQMVEEWAGGEDSSIEIVELAVDVEDGVAEIDLVLASPGPTPSIHRLADTLVEELGRPVEMDLQTVLTSTRSISASVPSSRRLERASFTQGTSVEPSSNRKPSSSG